MIYLKYAFVFKPEETWSHLNQFDSDLAAFFRERGLEAELVTTPEGQESIRILYISKTQELVPETDTQNSKKVLKTAGKSRDFDGRFKK